jgi:hypothetical protein
VFSNPQSWAVGPIPVNVLEQQQSASNQQALGPSSRIVSAAASSIELVHEILPFPVKNQQLRGNKQAWFHFMESVRASNPFRKMALNCSILPSFARI